MGFGFISSLLGAQRAGVVRTALKRQKAVRRELAELGPDADPAEIRRLKDLDAALTKIAEAT